MNPRFSRLSEIDKAKIADYIAAESPRQAIRFIQTLRDKARAAARDPRLYPVSRDMPKPLRRVIVGHHLIWSPLMRRAK